MISWYPTRVNDNNGINQGTFGTRRACEALCDRTSECYGYVHASYGVCGIYKNPVYEQYYQGISDMVSEWDSPAYICYMRDYSSPPPEPPAPPLRSAAKG